MMLERKLVEQVTFSANVPRAHGMQELANLVKSISPDVTIVAVVYVWEEREEEGK